MSGVEEKRDRGNGATERVAGEKNALPVILFGGTSEGHELAKALTARGQQVLLSVATEYGEMVLEPELREDPLLGIHTGRLDREQMEQWITAQGAGLVIDATHPYALEVTRQIREICAGRNIPLLRCLRGQENADGQEKEKGPQNARGDVRFSDSRKAAQWLMEQEDNVLLTTGTKDLEIFSALPCFEERVYARVLPAVSSLEACLRLGLKGRHVIAMQGPFSVETNLSQLHEFDCRFLVTKDTGVRGGFGQKLEAAKLAGAISLVIGRQEREQGLTIEETIAAWSRWRQGCPQ